MGAQANAAPVIIKRKKIVKGGGHHGGAWKVAYADFVTAMMAFFMLMWLLNATTEKQKQGLADYFTPTIPVVKTSGGGSGAFGGDSIFSEMTLTQSGTGASVNRVASEDKARGTEAAREDAENKNFESLKEMLLGHGGESAVMENLLEHIVTRITDEGLVIEVFSTDDFPIFDTDESTPTALLLDLVTLISGVSKTVSNQIAVEGHIRARPLVLRDNPVWHLSHDRADRVRVLLGDRRVAQDRIQRITGHADREPALRDTMAVRNDRVEIILLRDEPAGSK